MSKRPRRNRPPARRQDPATRPAPSTDPASFSAGDTTPAPGTAASGGGAGGRSTTTPRTTRPNRRTTRATRRVEPRKSFADRYRGVLLGIFALIGAGLIGFVFIQQTGAAAYTCRTLMTPGPGESLPTPSPTFRPTPTGDATASPSASPEASPSPDSSPSGSPGASGSPAASPSPSPGATQRIGFQAADLGNTHVSPGSTIDYAYCPPGSGDHYSAAGQGPLRREFYGPASEPRPGGWVHNLEHGWVVLAYRGGEGQEPTEAELAQMRTFFEDAPPSSFAGPCASPNKVMVLRFDEMDTDFAMLAWDRALMMDSFDPEQALTFYEQWVDSEQAAERGAC